MKIKLLFFSSALIALNLQAQITLTYETNAPRIGDKFTYYLERDVDLDVASGGENQVWDISTLNGQQSECEFISLEYASKPYFTESNLVEVSEQNGYVGETYSTASATGHVINGLIIPGLMEAKYTDGRDFLRFPISYNQEYDDTFEGTIKELELGEVFDVKGTTKIKADGYGTLKLPFATINNVLRVKVTSEYSYIYNFDPGNGVVIPYTFANLKDTIYLWYDVNTRYYLANYSINYADQGDGFSKLSATIQYLSPDDINSSVKNIFSNQSVAIYPNPTNGIANIMGAVGEQNIKIYDVNGTLLQQSKLLAINLSDYPDGIYLIEINGKIHRVIKQN